MEVCTVVGSVRAGRSYTTSLTTLTEVLFVSNFQSRIRQTLCCSSQCKSTVQTAVRFGLRGLKMLNKGIIPALTAGGGERLDCFDTDRAERGS